MIINDEILKKVIEKSMENAESLLADADLLKEAKRYQRAYALYQFSMEEVGKAISSVLLLTQIDTTADDLKEYRREFFRHPYKIKRSGALDSFICQVLYKGNYDGAMSFLQVSISENENKLDEYKNKSLYTAIVDDEVKTPMEMVGEKEMEYIWFRAVTRYKMAQPFTKMMLDHYEKLREYQRLNGSIKNMCIDTEKAAKEFWDEILTQQKI